MWKLLRSLGTRGKTQPTKCKKLKSIKCDGCPIKDNNVLGYITKGEYKQLAKYLEKTAMQGGGGGGKGKKKK